MAVHRRSCRPPTAPGGHNPSLPLGSAASAPPWTGRRRPANPEDSGAACIWSRLPGAARAASSATRARGFCGFIFLPAPSSSRASKLLFIGVCGSTAAKSGLDDPLVPLSPPGAELPEPPRPGLFSSRRNNNRDGPSLQDWTERTGSSPQGWTSSAGPDRVSSIGPDLVCCTGPGLFAQACWTGPRLLDRVSRTQAAGPSVLNRTEPLV